MNVYNLPDDIFPGSPVLKDDIIIHNYVAKVGTFNGKSILQKNAISLVVQGEKTMHYADHKVVTNNEEFHFLPAGNCLVTMEISPEKTFHSILIFFDNKVLINFLVKNEGYIQKVKRKTNMQPLPYLYLRKDDFIRNYIASLELLLSSTMQHMSANMKAVKFEELLMYLLEHYTEALLSFPLSGNNGFDEMKLRKVMETNITNKLTVEELAFLCDISISTFKRSFTKIYGTTPNKWLIRQRMQLAANLLHNNKEKPSEVFYKVGYENHSSFSQAFKQTFGLMPKEYQLAKMNARQHSLNV